jgi:hypothetical protein
MPCPLEKQFALFLEERGIEYTRPERDPRDPTNLDFHLPAIDLYVEVKQYPTPRLSTQLAKLPDSSDALVLVGRRAVEKFLVLITQGLPESDSAARKGTG